MKYPLPSLARLQKLFSYDPMTGVLMRETSRPKAPAGTAAGTKNNHGHLICRVDCKMYYVHRIAWLMHHGQTPPDVIDHINGDQADNRIDNLRLATVSENSYNRPMQKINKAGMKGAHYSNWEQRWRSSIKVNGKKIHLGWFDSKEEAASAYAKAAPLYHGDFARVS